MKQLVFGFWGAFFGTAALMLAGAVYAYTRSLKRVAVNTALAALASSTFVLVFLGALPIENVDTLARVLAHVECVVAVLLSYLLCAVLGVFRRPSVRHRSVLVMVLLAGLLIALGWALPPLWSLALSTAMAGLMGLVALGLCLRNVFIGDVLAQGSVAGVCFMLIGLTGLSWIALDRAHVVWQVHAVSALAGAAYLATMSSVLWARYYYLVELNRVRAYGPNYDLVTRMRSHSETGNMVSATFERHRSEPAPLGVIAVSVVNLMALEKLYGHAAVNQVLFVCAGRLRRTVRGDVDMGRLGRDSFLLLVRDGSETGRLIRLARAVQLRLSRPLHLNTGVQVESAEIGQNRWVAEIGVGVLKVCRADAHGSTAVSQARGMSRTALSYPSRVAWFDEKSGEIVGMPVLGDPGHGSRQD